MHLSRLCLCSWPRCEQTQMQDVQRCSGDGFCPFCKTVNYIHDSKKSDSSNQALKQQDLPLTDRTVQVSSVKIFHSLIGLSASLYSHTEKLRCVLFVCRSSLLNYLTLSNVVIVVQRNSIPQSLLLSAPLLSQVPYLLLFNRLTV